MWILRAWMDQGRSNDTLDAIDALGPEQASEAERDYLYGMGLRAPGREVHRLGCEGREHPDELPGCHRSPDARSGGRARALRGRVPGPGQGGLVLPGTAPGTARRGAGGGDAPHRRALLAPARARGPVAVRLGPERGAARGIGAAALGACRARLRAGGHLLRSAPHPRTAEARAPVGRRAAAGPRAHVEAHAGRGGGGLRHRHGLVPRHGGLPDDLRPAHATRPWRRRPRRRGPKGWAPRDPTEWDRPTSAPPPRTSRPRRRRARPVPRGSTSTRPWRTARVSTATRSVPRTRATPRCSGGSAGRG